MGTQIDDKTGATTKMTKQGVRDLNHLTASKAVLPVDAAVLPAEDAPVVTEPASVPIES